MTARVQHSPVLHDTQDMNGKYTSTARPLESRGCTLASPSYSWGHCHADQLRGERSVHGLQEDDITSDSLWLLT